MMEWDLGDVVASFNLRVKGRQRFDIRLRNGVPEPTTPDERGPRGPSTLTPTKGQGPIMDLAADHKLPVSVQWTDEVGNPTTTPDGAVVGFVSSDPGVVSITDNGDGTAECVATGALGSAEVTVHADYQGAHFEGSETINVVAGLAERVSMEFGEPVEVTPDDV